MASCTVEVIFMPNYLLLSFLGVIHSSPSPLSHHSVSSPPPLPSPPSLPPLLEDLPSHSRTFSLRLIPLTMHVPKTDLIFINGAKPAPPTQPHVRGPSLSCIASFPNPSPVPVEAHRLTSPLHHLETPPWPPHPNDTRID